MFCWRMGNILDDQDSYGSINLDGGVAVEMRIFCIDSQDFLEVGLMGLINECLGHSPASHFPPDALPDHHMQVEPGRKQDAGPSVPEEHSWELELVEEESELEEGLEHGEGLVLVHHHHWVDGVVVFQCVLNKALPVINPAADLIRGCQSGFLESPRQQADVLALLHQLFEVLVVDCLHAPQLEDGTGHWEIENEAASQTYDVSQRAFLDRIHEHEEAETQHAVWMDSEDASVLLGDDLLVDDFEVVEVLEGEEVLVDDVDVELAPPQGQLHDDHHQQPQDEVQIQREDSIRQDQDRHVQRKLCSREQQQRNYPLVLAKEALFLRFIDHQHYNRMQYYPIFHLGEQEPPGGVELFKGMINNFK